MRLAVVDTGALYAAADEDDQEHEACVRALERPDLRLVIPAMVVAEATYLIGARLGATVESNFLETLAQFDVRVPRGSDWLRIAQLVYEYRGLPLGGTDASVIALAEILGTPTLVTVDRRDFRVVRPRHCEAFELLPDEV
ncbi:MAG: PIN domain-containing protein [Candidatus Dormibacteraeota bacterium]|nr:PIN domain-containing protein [Candidatus Dormibacteraeota bacterium]